MYTMTSVYYRRIGGKEGGLFQVKEARRLESKNARFLRALYATRRFRCEIDLTGKSNTGFNLADLHTKTM
jgi:hypothetical protein